MKALIITTYILLSALSGFTQSIGIGGTPLPTNQPSSIRIGYKTDTIPLIILYCNTESREGYDTPWAGPVKWMRGYSVRRWIDERELALDGGMTKVLLEGMMMHSHYIDYNKKPLSKNIIVWQVK